jgi:hypothetical protein
LVLVSGGFEKTHKLVGFERELHKIDGIWYWVVFADVPSPWY